MFLGLDIGTSAVKAVLLDERGILRGEASTALTVSRSRPSWSEQDADDWWNAVGNSVMGLDAGLRAAVRGIGLSGQMHGATVLDKAHRPLRPAIRWNDGRSGAECDELEQVVPDLWSITGNRAMPGFTAPKLLWLRRHEPGLFAQIAAVLLPKDYVRLKMTGDLASDMSDSAGTLWLDVARRAWSLPVLEACGQPLSAMPRLHEGTAITGRLRPEVARAWGMDSVPVVAGAGDNAAGAIAAGVVGPGEAMLSLGTSGVVFVAEDRPTPAPQRAVHCFCHALPETWHVMSVMLSAASCLDWATGLLAYPSVAALLSAAALPDSRTNSELFLPYLSGERTPHNDPHARGAFVGISHETTAGRLAQAVLEGVSMGLRDGLDALVAAGAGIDSLSVIGGGSRSAYWGEILAAVLNRPLLYREGSAVGPAVGAARLARIAVDRLQWREVCTPPAVQLEVEPKSDLVAHYAARRPRFRSLYRALQPIFQGEAA